MGAAPSCSPCTPASEDEIGFDIIPPPVKTSEVFLPENVLTCAGSFSPPDVVQASSSKKTVLCALCAGNGCDVCASLADPQNSSICNSERTTPVRSACNETRLDCHELLRSLYLDVLLAPCLNSFDGWPLSTLALHLMECKQALVAAPETSKQAMQKFIFGNTEKPDTHRQCSVWLHRRQYEYNVRGLTLSGQDLRDLPSVWRETMRNEALSSRNVKLQPGTSIINCLVGAPCSQDEQSQAATDVHLHFLNPANPELYSVVFDFFQQFSKECFRLVTSTPLRTRTGPAMMAALVKLLPETHQIVQDILECENSEYMVAEDAKAAGVLKHSLRSRWNLNGILRRFGKTQEHIFRYRPMYTWRMESQTQAGFVALTMIESRGHHVELCFLTSSSGKLVWSDQGGLPRMEGGDVLEVPEFFGNAFHSRFTDLTFPLRGIGCFGTADLPQLLLCVRAERRPHPVVDVSCVEIGNFPMEWFYKPLFDAKLMRALLVQHLTVGFHLLGDEIHVDARFQIPKLGSILKSVLKAISSKLVDIVFGSTAEDLPPILLAAFGKDLAVLESTPHSTNMPSKRVTKSTSL